MITIYYVIILYLEIELKCFHDHEEKSVPDHSGRASLVFDTRLLWDQDELQVYFMNPTEYAKCDQIIPLMNEWRGGNDRELKCSKICRIKEN